MATSFGSITIVDITDVGEFSVSPSCNSSLTVIYNEDSDTYSPAWGGNGSVALQITPSCYYAGSRVVANRYKWYRKEDSNNPTLVWDTNSSTSTTANGESVENSGSNKGKLTVSQNQFSNYSQLTYIVEAYYTVSGIDEPLMAQGQISFSKLIQNSDAKNVSVTGTNSFIYSYNSSGVLVPDYNTVTLSGRKTSNLSFAANPWSYGYDVATMVANNGTVITDTSIYNTSGNTANLTASTTFLGNHNSVIFRLSSNDSNVYDLFTVYKLVNGRDGAAGDKIIMAALDNDDQTIPFDKDGTGYYTDAVSTITVFEGNDDVTGDYNISLTPSDDGAATPTPTVTYTTTSNNRTVTITGITAPTGYVIFTCTPKQSSGRTGILTKKFSLNKIEAGVDGDDGHTPIYYDLKTSVLAVNATNTSNPNVSSVTYSPSTVIFTAWKHEYNETNSVWEQTIDTTNDIYINGSKATRESSGTNVGRVVVTLSAGTTYTDIVGQLRKGSTTDILDTQTVVITTDGSRGQIGPEGEDGAPAVNLILGNEHQNFPTTAKKKTSGSISITIPVELKVGAITRNDLITNGVSNLTLNFGGSPAVTTTLTWDRTNYRFTGTISDNTKITNNSGNVSVTIPYYVPDSSGTATQTTATVTKTFTWATSAAGAESVILQIATPDGKLFDNGTGSLRVVATLEEGLDDVSSNAVWEWYKYQSGYQKITGATTSSYTVNANDVHGFVSLKIVAKYDADGDGTREDYVGYVSLEDHGDVLQVTVHSTVGNQLVNGQGAGAIYARVMFNGKQIDAIKTGIEVVDTLPSVSDTREQVILLNVPQSGNKSAVLYSHTTGTAWKAMGSNELPFQAQYIWTFRNDSDEVISGSTLGIDTSGKCLYVDKSVVNNKLTADVEVVYPKTNN